MDWQCLFMEISFDINHEWKSGICNRIEKRKQLSNYYAYINI